VQGIGLGESAEQSTPRWRSVSVGVGGQYTVARQRDAAATSKETKTDAVFTSFITSTFSICDIEWQFEIRISICTNDISFIVYRLTSLVATYVRCGGMSTQR